MNEKIKYSFDTLSNNVTLIVLVFAMASIYAFTKNEKLGYVLIFLTVNTIIHSIRLRLVPGELKTFETGEFVSLCENWQVDGDTACASIGQKGIKTKKGTYKIGRGVNFHIEEDGTVKAYSLISALLGGVKKVQASEFSDLDWNAGWEELFNQTI